jgi:hypothetical protein
LTGTRVAADAADEGRRAFMGKKPRLTAEPIACRDRFRAALGVADVELEDLVLYLVSGDLSYLAAGVAR